MFKTNFFIGQVAFLSFPVSQAPGQMNYGHFSLNFSLSILKILDREVKCCLHESWTTNVVDRECGHTPHLATQIINKVTNLFHNILNF